MTSLKLIYDDSVPVPAEVVDVVGIRHFGDLLHGKKRLSAIVARAADLAGIKDVVHIRHGSDLTSISLALSGERAAQRYLYMPANIIALGGTQALSDLFAKLRWLRQNVCVTASVEQGSWSGVATLDLDAFRRLVEQRSEGLMTNFTGERRGNFADIGNGAELIDLNDKGRLLKFLGSHFEVRHFNHISYDDYTIRKASANKDKIRREYVYWGLLPERMKFWFVQPFDFQEEASTASYAMERLNIPDMALQWIHGAVSPETFNRFLDRAFYFLQQRPEKRLDRPAALALRHSLYRDKLTVRLNELRQSTCASQIDGLLRAIGIGDGGDALEALADRYFQLLDHHEPRRADARAVVGHGDFCFSNILYEKASNLMRLIDPRGADRAEDLWTDPYYDVAKLSHSVLGNYDFINNGLFDLTLATNLSPELSLNIASPIGEMQQAFSDRVLKAGFDPDLVRLYEASLFLSMAPLHIDSPSKVTAFLINAHQIMEILESGRSD
jgi:hypothetical protein